MEHIILKDYKLDLSGMDKVKEQLNLIIPSILESNIEIYKDGVTVDSDGFYATYRNPFEKDKDKKLLIIPHFDLLASMAY
jgi:hypothetical protein